MVYAVLTFRALLAGVFLVSVAGKLRGYEAFSEFTESARRLGGLRAGPALPVAFGVVAAEAATVVLLAVPRTVIAGFLVAGTLLLGFALALARALRRGTVAPCRCFGGTAKAAAEPIGRRHVVRNAVLTACALTGAVLAPSTQDTAVNPGAVVLCLFGAAIAVGAVVLLDDLVHLLRPAPIEGNHR